MFVQVHTATVRGVDAFRVRVEVNLAAGLPSFTVVGLAQGSVREGRERVAAALRNSGYGLPNRKITVNLAPADVRKAGTAFDLPIAVGILAAAGHVPPDVLARLAFLGELGLDGAVRGVSGVLSVALRCAEDGIEELVVPEANIAEARMVEDLEVRPARHLGEVVACLRGEEPAEGTSPPVEREGAPVHREGEPVDREGALVEREGRRGSPSWTGVNLPGRELDLADVRGQQGAKRALKIAAAGAHNLLMIGPPGSGKTMLARRLPGLLPPLTRAEALEVAQIQSVAGLLVEGGLPRGRPFRAPHHSVSYAGLHGGGRPLRPGEVSLAHHGVLFLDELPEYRRDALEMLRQPLEEGQVRLSRAGSAVDFPARFLLVAAMNPCPCGFHGDGSDRCICDPAATTRYRARVSGPLLDRVDLHVDVPALSATELEERRGGEATAVVAGRVGEARERQLRRFSDCRDMYANAQMPSSGLRGRCRLKESASTLLQRAARGGGLSARGYDRVLRVARTIADLDGADAVDACHLGEALQYRPVHLGPGL